MTPEERQRRDLWLAEMWTPVHELSRAERAEQHLADEVAHLRHQHTTETRKTA